MSLRAKRSCDVCEHYFCSECRLKVRIQYDEDVCYWKPINTIDCKRARAADNATVKAKIRNRIESDLKPKMVKTLDRGAIPRHCVESISYTKQQNIITLKDGTTAFISDSEATEFYKDMTY